ncbi:hypothetical protein HHK36_024154 [Tetracentron sinense]|uniref:CCHC-type domain-containing protein n=1 Tax=Tetracentron sinense TaxID=13715 RepID=A0A834YKH3_TETSI|nr:hypothetical protein HHK36_024154 [Tetracentron sinense]
MNRGKLPPGPVPLPIVGSLFKLGDRPHESLAELAQTYGPLMTLKLGRITTVVVSSPSMAKEVLQNNDQAFANRTIPDSVRALNHHEVSMVWLPALSKWRNLRKLSNTNMFTAQKLDANHDLRSRKVQDLLAHVRDCFLAGRAVDIGRAAFTTSLNLIWNTLFSNDLADANSSTAQEFKDLVWGVMEETGRPNLVDYFPVLRLIDPQGIRRRQTNYFSKIIELFDGMIKQRLQSRVSPTYLTQNDLLDTILNHMEDHSFEINRTDVKHLFLSKSGTENPKNPTKSQTSPKESVIIVILEAFFKECLCWRPSTFFGLHYLLHENYQQSYERCGRSHRAEDCKAGVCYQCGKPGQIKRHCPSLQQNSGNGGNGRVFAMTQEVRHNEDIIRDRL